MADGAFCLEFGSLTARPEVLNSSIFLRAGVRLTKDPPQPSLCHVPVLDRIPDRHSLRVWLLCLTVEVQSVMVEQCWWQEGQADGEMGLL